MGRSKTVGIVTVALCASMVLAGPAGAWDRRPHYYEPPPRAYHHHDHGGDVALGVGLGILGLGMAAAMTAPPAYYAPPPPPVYYAPPPPPPVYYQPAPMAANQTSGTFIDEDGQTCREYQTTVVVNGRRQAAYGTACLDGNGTWRVAR